MENLLGFKVEKVKKCSYQRSNLHWAIGCSTLDYAQVDIFF